MSDTVRERVLAAFAAKVALVSGVTVERNRDYNVTAFPALVVLDGGQQAEDDNTGYTRYTMTVDVEGYVGAGSLNVGNRLNELYGKMLACVMADRTLGGLAIDISEQELDISINREEGQARTGAFLATFSVEYFTAQGNPYVPGPA
jgi:hypothetical protein